MTVNQGRTSDSTTDQNQYSDSANKRIRQLIEERDEARARESQAISQSAESQTILSKVVSNQSQSQDQVNAQNETSEISDLIRSNPHLAETLKEGGVEAVKNSPEAREAKMYRMMENVLLKSQIRDAHDFAADRGFPRIDDVELLQFADNRGLRDFKDAYVLFLAEKFPGELQKSLDSKSSGKPPKDGPAEDTARESATAESGFFGGMEMDKVKEKSASSPRDDVMEEMVQKVSEKGVVDGLLKGLL